jgi:peptide/nickel transport system substrate-binding protein
MYEVETTIDPDQYNLWHSLKVDYPNLNLSGYEYERVDILLEDARVELTKKDRIDYYDLFQEYLMRDVPALFLYHPKYVYVVPEDLNGPDLSNISFPEERFQNISEWSF